MTYHHLLVISLLAGTSITMFLYLSTWGVSAAILCLRRLGTTSVMFTCTLPGPGLGAGGSGYLLGGVFADARTGVMSETVIIRPRMIAVVLLISGRSYSHLFMY